MSGQTHFGDPRWCDEQAALGDYQDSTDDSTEADEDDGAHGGDA